MVELVFSEVRATEGDFEGEAVDDPQLFPQRNPSCSFSVLLHLEGAILELEDRAVILHEHGEDLLLLRSIPRAATIYEDVFLAIVAVDVATEGQLSLLLDASDQLLREVDAGVRFL